MAERNLTSFTVNSLLIGLLLMGLLTFYVSLANNEGRGEIFDDYPEIEALNFNVTQQYTDGGLIDTSNINSNLSADYNPEIAISAADQSGNAINTNLQDISSVTWATIGILLQLMFGSVVGAILSSLMISVVGFLVVYYIIKSIRTGT